MGRSGKKFDDSTQEFHSIRRVRFGVLSSDEIKNMAAFNIEFKEGAREVEILNDHRMGAMEYGSKCTTCGCDSHNCPGHFGALELEKPVYHISYLTTTMKILACVCFKCSRLRLPSDNEKLAKIKKIHNRKRKLDELYRLLRGEKVCTGGRKKKEQKDNEIDDKQIDGCGADFPKYTREVSRDYIGVTFEFLTALDGQEDRKGRLSAEKALQILSKIKKEDAEFMGFDTRYTKPESLVIKVLPIAPRCVRPQIEMESSYQAQDDITRLYVNILKQNEEIKKAVRAGDVGTILDEKVRDLQRLCTAVVDNEVNNTIPITVSNRRLKTFTARIKGKEGRIRGNLMGKRVDFSARTVITPDPSLSLDELGVPLSIAKRLSFPEIVTHRNKDDLQRYVENGPDIWPGANYIKRGEDRENLKFNKNRTKIVLMYGDVVERHLMEGDVVIFNRQPSLHRMSMMGHRVRVLPYSSFRLNLSVVTPYNADFDGDEMNMHVPQSYETKSEIKWLMAVPFQMVSPQKNSPVMGIVQDALVGVRIFTTREIFLERDEVMNLVMWVDGFDGNLPKPAILKPKMLWTGKQIISMIFPSDLNYNDEEWERVPKDLNSADTKVIILRGELLSGYLAKATVGNTAGGIVHNLWLEKGGDEARIFLSAVQRIINNWLITYGFSVGIQDTVPTHKIRTEVEEIAIETEQSIQDTFNTFIYGEESKLEELINPGFSMIQSFESAVNATLNEKLEKCGNLAKEQLDNKNNIVMMVTAGSKGSIQNISQIMAMIGQTNLEGRRIQYGFAKRTLPHFPKYDVSGLSRGFVAKSYIQGLTPAEFYFHTMGGREGLIDTAIKTSETGYTQRRLIKALEDVMVKYDSTVRDSHGNIIQFLYGEDGMAGEYVEPQKLELPGLSDEEFKARYQFLTETEDLAEKVAEARDRISDEVIQRINNFSEQEFTETVRELRAEYHWLLEKKQYLKLNAVESRIVLPINMARFIQKATLEAKIRPDSKSNLLPLEVIQKVNELVQKLKITHGNDDITRDVNEGARFLLEVKIRESLSTKRLIYFHRFNRAALENLIGMIETRYFRSISHPGEMVGSIAAQSVGETVTQMTLNTFHSAGISKKNVTLGLPRIKEILSATRHMKTPSMRIIPATQDEESLKNFPAKFEIRTLGDFTKKSEIYYDPFEVNNATLIEGDKEFVEFDYEYETENQNENMRYSPWVLRIAISERLTTLPKHITLVSIKEMIETKLRQFELPRLNIVVPTNTNFDNLFLRIRFIRDRDRSDEELGPDGQTELDQLRNIENLLLEQLKITGVKGIKKVLKRTVNRRDTVYDSDGSNLRDMFFYDDIDYTRTTTNDILEVYAVLGIEAARKKLLSEIRSVLSSYNIALNYRHLSLLSDIMTHRGYVMAISRTGINRVDFGPLRRASFEETIDQLMQAAMFAETDELTGVSENIMLGQLVSLGTGYFDVMLDTARLKDPLDIPPTSEDFIGFEPGDMEHEDHPAIATPNIPDTPHPEWNKMSSYQREPHDDRSGSFTPSYPNMQSPYGMPSRIVSGAYQSPGGMTPGYSADRQMLSYSPTSPNYTPGSLQGPNSPSYNISMGLAPGSQSGGSGSLYSPSPSHSPASPKYPSSSPSYHSGSPLSSNPSSSVQVSSHSPTSPGYGGQVAHSPVYNQPNPVKHEDIEEGNVSPNEDEEEK